MRAATRAWFAETHGADFELLRHFAGRFFDGAPGASGGEWRKVAIGVFTALLSLSIIGLKMYITRYHHANPPYVYTPEVYQRFVREDMLSFIGIAIAGTVLLTLLLWQSLFPSLRDLLALASLPVSTRQIFQAKFLALVLLFSAYTLALTAPVSAAFTLASSGRFQLNPSAWVNMTAVFSALAGACALTFFSLLSLQGLLLNLLPAALFARVSLFVQAALFVVTAGAVPLLWRQPSEAVWWPPVWFLRLWEWIAEGRSGVAQPALLAIAVPPALCVAVYLFSYGRYRRLLLEAPRHHDSTRSGFASLLLERFMAAPQGQAAFSFIWKTLARSRTHRLILLAYAGAALGWIVKGALDTPTPTLQNQGMYGFLSVVVPLALAMLIAVALRYVFTMPVALEANWLFRIIDRDGRNAWLQSVERFVICCGIAPVFAVSLPAAVAILGPVRAAAAGCLGFAAALVWFEILFRQWNKLPFTCSYIPAKKPIILTMTRYGFGIMILIPAGHIILRNSADAISFLALLSFELVVWWKLRRQRLEFWAQCDLCYQEAPETDVSPLELKAAEDGIETGHGAVRAAEMFTGTLVESRGFVPEDWAQEIREDRRRPAQLLSTFVEDARLALRLIRRNPVLAAVVVATLTIGIGINASAFTVLNAFALRPHVYRDPGSFLRIIPKSRLRRDVRQVTYAEYTNFRDHSRTLRHLGAFTYFPAFLGDDDSGRSVGMAVSCNLFVVDGLERPIAGRLFTEDDCGRGREPVAIIDESVWRTRYASDPSAIGRTLELNGRLVRIVGVAPDSTTGWARPANLWVPYTAQELFEPGVNLFGDKQQWLSLAGRLARGFSRSAAEAELTALAKQHDRFHPGRDTIIDSHDGSWLEEIRLTLSGRNLMLLSFFFGAFNLVLFVSCANVATLLLSRAAARRKEIAIRLSLGAPRIRLVRMLVTESLVLAVVAGGISAILTWRLPPRLFEFIAARPPDFPIHPDWRTFLFVSAVVILTGVLSGLAPALESLKGNLTLSLKGGSPAQSGLIARGRTLHPLLVGAQVALSMVLLVEASLFSRAEERTLHADPGFRSRDVVVAPLWFRDDTPLESVAARAAAIAERARSLPGARSVAFSAGFPMFSYETVELKPPGRPDAVQPIDVHSASPGFFETLGIPLVRGRELGLGELHSVIVSESLARIFWRRVDPIGKSIELPAGTFTVAGVVRDVDPLRFGGSENPVLYVPWQLKTSNFLTVRFESGIATAGSAVRAAIRDVDPNLVTMAQRLQSWVDHVTKELWNVVGLIVMLGFIAMFLSTTGIYGAVSFAVSQRSRELAIRAALGAGKLRIVWEVVRAGGAPVVKGLVVGLWLSAMMAGGLHQSVKGSPLRLDTSNPALYTGAALLILGAAAAAMAIPARRGARSNPMDALRCD